MIKHSIKKILIYGLIAAFIILIGIIDGTLGVEAAETTAGATFIGQYADKLKLTVDNDKFFEASIMNPGDTWDSHLKVKNSGNKPLQVSLKEIVNNLPESTLLDILDLRITRSDGTVLYEGKYSKSTPPVIDWITLNAGEELNIDVLTGFPPEAGNEYQNQSFDSTWVFEVRAEEDVTPEPGNPTPGPDGPTPTPGPGGPTPEPDVNPTPLPDDDDPSDNIDRITPTVVPPNPQNTQNPTVTQNPSNPTYNNNTDPNYYDPRKGTDAVEHTKSDDVKTGDDTPIVTLVIILALAALMAGFIAGRMKKGGHDNEQE